MAAESFMGDVMEKYKGAMTEEAFNPGTFNPTAGTNEPVPLCVRVFARTCRDRSSKRLWAINVNTSFLLRSSQVRKDASFLS